MGATATRLLLVTRRYVDLRRVSSALCRVEG
ncbi:putative leader peptide [Saccharopolyspora rosea]|uniref:Leader peptide n=1 Tax=Saccharopolyspora rosea TaxID=524884 RepID=A0ABW3FWB8_9PSEU|nr:putative leader peptide [Saccharopolyspora rosea]